jgi:hypothetical protein
MKYVFIFLQRVRENKIKKYEFHFGDCHGIQLIVEFF